MRLQFVNVSNGEPQREVDARLVKVGNRATFCIPVRT